MDAGARARRGERLARQARADTADAKPPPPRDGRTATARPPRGECAGASRAPRGRRAQAWEEKETIQVGLKLQEYLIRRGDDPENVYEVFKAFDSGGNDALDVDEFREALKVLGWNVGNEKVNKLFSMFDHDGSGQVEYSEVRSRRPKPLPPPPPPSLSALSRVPRDSQFCSAIFPQLDDSDEVESMLRRSSLHLGSAPEEEIQRSRSQGGGGAGGDGNGGEGSPKRNQSKAALQSPAANAATFSLAMCALRALDAALTQASQRIAPQLPYSPSLVPSRVPLRRFMRPTCMWRAVVAWTEGSGPPSRHAGRPTRGRPT